MRDAVVHIVIALLKLFYRLCTLCPTGNRWVLISRQSDRAPLDFRLIAQWCARQDQPIQVVILAKQLHNPVSYIFEMVKQLFYIATSKAVILDSYCIVVSLLGDSIKAPVVQIWHALGNMKKFGYTALDSEEGRSSATAYLMRMHEGYNAVAISSLSFRDDFAAGFDIDPRLLFESPLPRVDLLVDKKLREAQRIALLQEYPQLQGKMTIVYCPTFRKVLSSNAREATRALIEAVDFTRYNLIYKPHPVSTQVVDDPRVITITTPDPLFVADYVISDYSTVIYEAGLLDVPVYLFAYDWKDYGQKRGMNIDIEKDVPTLFTDNAVEIIQAIENNDFDHEAYRAFIRHNIALPESTSCTDHLCRYIQSLTNSVG